MILIDRLIKPIVALALILCLTHPANAQERTLTTSEQFAYGSSAFDRFVRDSYAWTNVPAGDIPPFYKAFDTGSRKVAEDARATGLSEKGVSAYLTSEKARISAISDVTKRAAAQTELSATIFRVVKKALPLFSLDRGFEFTSATELRERQCLLQSVLAAGMLQKAGVPAGVAMVWKSERGAISNLSHVVAIVRMADGADRVLDISSDRKTKFVPDLPHQGLYLSDGANGYRFVEPQYDDSHRITAYRLTGTTQEVKPESMRPLDTSFIRSQFFYYRGERAGGHLIWSPLDPRSLTISVDAFTRSLKECPQNPLTTYMLGKVLAWQGKNAEAQNQFVAAYRLYRAQGRVPDSAQEVYALEASQQAKDR